MTWLFGAQLVTHRQESLFRPAYLSLDIPIFGSQDQSAPPCAHPVILSRSGRQLFVGKNDEYVQPFFRVAKSDFF